MNHLCMIGIRYFRRLLCARVLPMDQQWRSQLWFDYALRPSLLIVFVDGSIRIVILIFFDFVMPVSLSEFVKTHINQI